MAKKTKPNELAIKETTEVVSARESVSVESLIQQAIDKNVSVETMERLLAMRRDLKEERAKEQFSKSMALFQAECPVIKKDKAGGKTNSGVVAYYYAPLESIITQVSHLVQHNGFRYNFQTVTGEDKVKVTCIVTHDLGHSEKSDVEVPLGAKTGVMSAPQVTASALTFAKRYAFCNAFGIMTGDEDNDAQTVRPKAPEKATVREIAHETIEEPIREEISDKTKIYHLCGILGIDTYKTDAKERIRALTSLEVEEKNYPEIVSRLEVLVKDQEENRTEEERVGSGDIPF